MGWYYSRITFIQHGSASTEKIHYVCFNKDNSFDNIQENVAVKGEHISMTSDYRNTKNKVSYAVRYKGTKYRSAWKYEYYTSFDDYHNSHMKITARIVDESVNIDNIANDTTAKRSA